MSAPSRVRLRPATEADIPDLERWDREPHVLACMGKEADDDPADWRAELAFHAQCGEVLIAELDGRSIGVLQIIDPHRDPSQYWGEMEPGYRAIDIWIGEADLLGQGHGTAMMRQALARCFADRDVEAVLIDPLESNTDAIRFYRRLGFRDVGPRRFDEDDCLVLKFDRADFR